MRGIWTAALMALALGACSAPQTEGAPAMEAAIDRGMVASTTEASVPAESDRPALAVTAPMLAYEHRAVVELPAAALEPMVRRHEQACRDAGPTVCLVIGSSAQAYGEDERAGELILRAEPSWLAEFRASLEGQAKEARGRIREQSVTTEDLTVSIVDTEARLRALETLRGRLEGLLRTRPGKLSELLELERELARVQGELDAQRSSLAVMRGRVAMSLMTLTYQSRPVAVASGAFEPIADAGADFLRLLSEATAALIRVVAVLLPWAVVLGLLGWVGWRRWRARRRIKPTAEPLS